MRKIGAPAQGQPASVDTDGTRLLLTGGKHDGVGCWMPPPPDAQGRPVGEKGRRGYELGYEFGYWLGCIWGQSSGIVGVVIGEPREVSRAA